MYFYLRVITPDLPPTYVSHVPRSGSRHVYHTSHRGPDLDSGHALPMRQPAWPANASSRVQANTDDEHKSSKNTSISPEKFLICCGPSAVLASSRQLLVRTTEGESPPIGFTSTCSSIAKISRGSWRKSFSSGAQPDGRIFPSVSRTRDCTAYQVPPNHAASILMD